MRGKNAQGRRREAEKSGRGRGRGSKGFCLSSPPPESQLSEITVPVKLIN